VFIKKKARHLPKQKNYGAPKEYGGEDTRKMESKENPESMETKSKKRQKVRKIREEKDG